MKTPPALLKDPVAIEVFRGAGGLGPLYRDAAVKMGEVSWTRRVVTDASGNDVVTEGSVVFGPDVDVTEKSRLTIEGRKVRVVTVAKPTWLGNRTSVEVTFA